jgi:hypothetical protein
VGGSVEVDAVPPAAFRMVEARIRRHIDAGAHARLLEVEDAERETLELIAERGGR